MFGDRIAKDQPNFLLAKIIFACPVAIPVFTYSGITYTVLDSTAAEFNFISFGRGQEKKSCLMT